MLDYRHILWERQGRILTLRLNRPAVLNAFDAQMHTEMAGAFVDVAADPDCDLVILTGAGRAFSAGGDLQWQQSAIDRPATFERTVREAKQIVFSMLDCDKPIIARINGPAVGFGATLALLCDISFIARSAYIADPHVGVGMVAGDGAAVIWPQLIGYARAKQYLFTGDRIDAEQAARIGLVNQVVDDERLDHEVDAFARRLLAGAQQAIRWTKLSINIGLRQLASSMLDASLAYESITNVSADHQEGVAAFREKRSPRFGRVED